MECYGNQPGGVNQLRGHADKGGHDPWRPRAQLVSDRRHAACSMARERMVPSRRP
jgi:hypothetical protein